ncbi:DUF6207 family protein [Streptomyces sp. NPDC049627]|uniref:DUF6207 family protein n=1 Tax=Streptomyces sp. NPDC049627 TaxID=3365595 RepID=UPI0037BB745D
MRTEGDRDIRPYARDLGQPGVRLHCYLDVRQEINTQTPARGCSALTCPGRADGRGRPLFADGRAGWKAWGCDAGAAGTDTRRPCVRPGSAAALRDGRAGTATPAAAA